MQHINAIDNLVVKLARLRLWHVSILYNVVEHLPSFRTLHDKVDGVLRVKHLVQLDDVPVPRLLQYFDLSIYAPHVSLFLYLILLEDFYCHLHCMQTDKGHHVSTQMLDASHSEHVTHAWRMCFFPVFIENSTSGVPSCAHHMFNNSWCNNSNFIVALQSPILVYIPFPQLANGLLTALYQTFLRRCSCLASSGPRPCDRFDWLTHWNLKKSLRSWWMNLCCCLVGRGRSGGCRACRWPTLLDSTYHTQSTDASAFTPSTTDTTKTISNDAR
jgi:hypothetical protein